MSSRRAFLFAATAALFSCSNVARSEERLEKFAFEKAEMGVPFRITLYAPDEATAKRAAEAGFARVEA